MHSALNRLSTSSYTSLEILLSSVGALAIMSQGLNVRLLFGSLFCLLDLAWTSQIPVFNLILSKRKHGRRQRGDTLLANCLLLLAILVGIGQATCFAVSSVALCIPPSRKNKIIFIRVEKLI